MESRHPHQFSNLKRLSHQLSNLKQLSHQLSNHVHSSLSYQLSNLEQLSHQASWQGDATSADTLVEQSNAVDTPDIMASRHHISWRASWVILSRWQTRHYGEQTPHQLTHQLSNLRCIHTRWAILSSCQTSHLGKSHQLTNQLSNLE